jgi:acyl-CoA thioesterase FadM
VWLRVAEVTRRTIGYSCFLSKGDTHIATGAMTIACVRRRANQSMEAIDIPADVAARFQAVPGSL